MSSLVCALFNYDFVSIVLQNVDKRWLLHIIYMCVYLYMRRVFDVHFIKSIFARDSNASYPLHILKLLLYNKMLVKFHEFATNYT